jgi:hypothetical protein
MGTTRLLKLIGILFTVSTIGTSWYIILIKAAIMDKENVIKCKQFYLGKYVGITVPGNLSNRLGVC